MNLPPWQADSQFPTAPPPETVFTQRLSDDDDTAPLPVLPRPSSSAAASDFGAASTHVSESADPAAASLSFTPGGQWWNEVAQFGIRTNNPEHELTHAGIVGLEGEYVRGAGQTDCSPTRSVVNPVVIEDVTAVDSQSSGDAIEVFVIERPCSAQCWAAEG